MNIAYLSTFPPYRGGIAQFNETLSEQFRALGHGVEKITFKRQYPGLLFPGKSQYLEGWETRQWEAHRWLDTIHPLSWWTTARAIVRLRPDVLFMRYWIPFLAPSQGTVAWWLRRKRIPSVAIADNVIPHEHRPGDRALTRFFLRRLAGAIVMSETVEAQLQSIAPRLPYRLIPHPVYTHFPPPMPRGKARQALGLPMDARVLLFTGFIRKYKGLDLLIEALTELPPNYHLLIGGEVYGDAEEYSRLIERLQVGERVHPRFHFLSDAEMAQFWSAADVAVLPYRHATQSGVLALAYHYEVPVVVTPVGDLPATVRRFGIGRVAAEVSAPAIAAAVRALETDAVETYQKNLRNAREALSWPRFAAEVTDFLKAVVGEKALT